MTSRILMALLCALSTCALACSEEPSTHQTNAPTTNPKENNSEEDNPKENNTPNTPEEDPNTPNTPEEDPSTSEEDPSTSEEDPITCSLPPLQIETPINNQAHLSDDRNPDQPGIQILLNLTHSPENPTILTLENLTTGESTGARAEPRTTALEMTLVEGQNALIAHADTDTCSKSSEIVTLTLTIPTCEDGPVCTSNDECAGECVNHCCTPAETGAHRFVLVEDLTAPVNGRTPGADVDAIGLFSEVRGREFFASNVEDAHIAGPENRFADPSALLGAPDSECEVKNFTSLGGRDAGAYVIVSFSTPDNPLWINNGDVVKVYEIGGALCGQYDDDPYKVSVSVSTEVDAFLEVGQANGFREITVGGL